MNTLLIILSIFSILLCVCFSIYVIIKYKKTEEEIYKIIINKKNNEIEQQYTNRYKELQNNYINDKEAYKRKELELQEEYNKRKIEYEEKQKLTNTLINNEKDKIDNEIKQYRQLELVKITGLIEKEKDKKEKEMLSGIWRLQEDIELQSAAFQKEFEEQIAKQKQQLSKYQTEVEEYRQKRETINQQIAAERELKEKSDYFRIKLSESDISDLLLIEELKVRFNNKELLNRAAFDTYIKKPMNEMIKRVLNGKSPSGIYMITNLKTNEIYIGRAVSIDKRWQEHCKSCFGVGTIARSTLHTTMAREGIWNFGFQLLEEVDKDKLSEREKYWIDFYQTKQYGMNEKAGG